MHKDYRSSHCWLIELVTIWPVCDNFKANTKLHVVYHGCCVTLERINNAAASSNHLHSKTTYIVTARKWPTRHNFVIHNVLFPGTGPSHNGGDSTHPDVCLVWRQHIALGRHSYHWMLYTRSLLDWQTPEWLCSMLILFRVYSDGEKKHEIQPGLEPGLLNSSQMLLLSHLVWSRGDMVQWISLRHDTNSARQGLAATTSKLGIYRQQPLSTGSVDKNIWLEFRRPRFR